MRLGYIPVTMVITTGSLMWPDPDVQGLTAGSRNTVPQFALHLHPSIAHFMATMVATRCLCDHSLIIRPRVMHAVWL